MTFWKTYKLEEVLDALIDYRGKTPKKTLSGIPLVTAKIVKNGFIQTPNEFIAEEDYDGWMTRGIPKIGDVVLTVEAPLGEVAQIKSTNIALAQRIITLRGKKDILDNGFLKYFLQSDVGQNRLKERETGTTVTGIKQSELRLVEIDCPDIKTQSLISSILSSLDNKIELNRQTNKTLEAIAQTLFKEMCLPKGEELPEGRRIGKLGKIIEINPKLALKKSAIAKYVEMRDLSEDSAIIKRYLDREFSSGSKFQNGDTLLARITPCLENGKTGLVDLLEDNEVGWGSTEFIVLRGKKQVGFYFVYCLSRLQSFRDFAIQSMVGSSGRQRVVDSILAEYELVIPSDKMLLEFHHLVKPIFEKIFINYKESQTLAAIRDSLLPKLMKGEIELN